jgi:trimethylamine:corrinoid methyltransferase-like protein
VKRSVSAERAHMLTLIGRFRATDWRKKGERRHLKRAIERSARRLRDAERQQRGAAKW